MTTCPFCRIIAGYDDAEIVDRGAYFLAIVPLEPVTPGHLLVIPTAHVADFTTKPRETGYVATIAADLAADRGGDWNLITSAGAAASQTVEHLHIHLVPRRAGDGLALPWTTTGSTT